MIRIFVIKNKKLNQNEIYMFYKMYEFVQR